MNNLRKIAGKIFGPRPETVSAARLYVAAVKQARDPGFYTSLGVPDTVAGRFELIALHGFLVMRRLKAERDAVRLLQAFANAVVDDLDRNLREMGVGDLSVGRKVKQFIQGFYGRIAAYEQGMTAGDEALRAALQRNLYAGADFGAWQLDAMTQYLRRQASALEAQPFANLRNGDISFQSLRLPASSGGK